MPPFRFPGAGEYEKVATVPQPELRLPAVVATALARSSVTAPAGPPTSAPAGPPTTATATTAPAEHPAGDDHVDRHHRAVHERLESIRARSEKANCWRSLTQYVTRLVNREGFVPLRVRLSRTDVAFLANARSDLLSFAGLGLRLVEMHRPREGGGISSDPASPIRRCRACMLRWPCPTFRALDEAVHGSTRSAG
jgi:hypothetical protein